MLTKVLVELKEAMKNGKNVIKSKTNPDRVMVMGPQNLKYILQRKGTIDGKVIYIPITVLLSHMSFK